MNPTCTFCGIEVNPSTAGTFRLVTGWAEARSRGGTHGLTGEELVLPTQSACRTCIKIDRRHERGPVGEQGTLL